jgi:glycine oxidase
MADSYDVVCVGGGVIGLLTACELARRGQSVAVVDKGVPGREASWAGAGILSPAPPLDRAENDLERLRAYSFEQFPVLADELQHSVGIDIGFRRTGGILLAFSKDAESSLSLECQTWSRTAIAHEPLDRRRLRELEPHLSEVGPAASFLPDTCQVRNPRLLRALTAVAETLGIALLADRPAIAFDCCCQRVLGVQFADGSMLRCNAVCVTAGAWSGKLLSSLGLEIPVHPVQGQIVAIETPGNVVHHIIEVGKRYLVPRDDGLVLVGSTEEDVGFEKQVTAAGVAGLREFAYGLFPDLTNMPIATTWAGLRPGCRLGRPIIGTIPSWRNVWVAAGHFRSGIQLSIGSARLLTDLLTGSPSIAAPDSFACPVLP